MIGAKPLRIRFDKADGFIRVYDGTKHVVLLKPEKYNAVFNRVRYLIGIKNSISYVISYYYTKISVASFDSLPLEKNLTFHKVIILIKTVFHKD